MSGPRRYAGGTAWASTTRPALRSCTATGEQTNNIGGGYTHVSKTLTILAGIALLSGSSVAADKEFVYSQKTGKLTLDGKEVGSGYSGAGDGKNNPDKEKEKNIGPIPRGLYKIGKAREWKGMPNCFDLTPDGHNAHGRTEFLIHGDSKKNPGNASEGCIILPPEVRKKVADSGVTQLQVVKD